MKYEILSINIMENRTLEILSNEAVNAAGNVFKMELSGCDVQQRPGQFVNIALDGLFLRRPISVCDWRNGVLTLLYKVVGKGTALMAAMKPGDTLDTLVSLGNGFTLPAASGKESLTAGFSDGIFCADGSCTSAGADSEPKLIDGVEVAKPVLVGGGIGTAPLYLLARRLLEAGVTPSVILGFNTAGEIVQEDEFKALGINLLIATADGIAGVKGFVTDALKTLECGYDYCYACGPMPMMRALAPVLASPAQFSLEERMGCGTGICMGCTCQTLVGAKRICKDGPVFRLSEISL